MTRPVPVSIAYPAGGSRRATARISPTSAATRGLPRTPIRGSAPAVAAAGSTPRATAAPLRIRIWAESRSDGVSVSR